MLAELIVPQLVSMLRAQGFDPEKVQVQIKQAVDDIHAMKESQDRCEAMLRGLTLDAKVAGEPAIEAKP
jgi:hypothetical protein